MSPLTGRCIELKVPDCSPAGCILEVPVAGDTVKVPLPEWSAGGDTVRILQREDGSWRVVRQVLQFSFRLPQSSPGERLKLRVPDGTQITFEVPEHFEPGLIVSLKRAESGGPWLFDAARALPPPGAQGPWQSDTSQGPYASMLELLRDKGYLQLLKACDGVLRVGVPFCGGFSEYATLGNFVAKHCLSLPGVDQASVFGVELFDSYWMQWALAQRWFEMTHPNITVQLEAGDLAEDPFPCADLVIGVHPEVTKGGCWFRIIASILHSCAQGMCVFTTFYEVEMKTLLNMINMNASGAIVETFENPFYADAADPVPAHPPMRYIIVVSGAERQ
eukprot:TRINITY_DN58178_c0_g1_i1.p1 TRINITY_DN58178_c0_g1~~TRINITY_DN58178_c0_g1_i1.p1  ORF type:complete len:372 (-),score=54.78 TRINITY_DN58178_c0_g1_i1:519-1517(-)